MVSIRLVVPLTFCTFLGFFIGVLRSFPSSTIQGWTKHSVAPQSSNASFSTHFRLLYIEIGILINLFQDIYTESVLQARVRAIALRLRENPLIHSPSL